MAMRGIAPIILLCLSCLACGTSTFNPGDPRSREHLESLVWDCLLRECHPCPALDWRDTRPGCWFRYQREITRSANAGSCGAPTAAAVGPGFGAVQKWAGGVLTPSGVVRGVSQSDAQFLRIDTTTGTASKSGPAISPLTGWRGGVLTTYGQIIGMPSNTTHTYLDYDPITETSVQFNNKANAGNASRGGVVAYNGLVYSFPLTNTEILTLDPLTRAVSYLDIAQTGWAGPVLGPDGRIYAMPLTATSVLVFDPRTNTANLWNVGQSGWRGGVLAGNGKIYGIPDTATSVLVIDPVAETVTTFGTFAGGGEQWTAGALGANGRVYAVPGNAQTNVLEIDPLTHTTQLLPTGVAADRWWGAVSSPNGLVYGIPFTAGQVLAIDPCANGRLDRNVLLSGFFNKM